MQTPPAHAQLLRQALQEHSLLCSSAAVLRRNIAGFDMTDSGAQRAMQHIGLPPGVHRVAGASHGRAMMMDDGFEMGVDGHDDASGDEQDDDDSLHERMWRMEQHVVVRAGY